MTETSKTLTSTVALVTGASSGIGAATARVLADSGAAVAIVARRGDRLEELASTIRDAGGSVLVIESDITDQEQAIAAVEATVAEFGRLDIVVNNAGVMLLGPIEGAPTEEWGRMIDLNISGMLYVSHAALPHLLRAADSEPRRVADLINVSSVAGRVARFGTGVYNATKWGVNAFTESLRQEVAERHVRVGVIEPGAVTTELVAQNRPEIQVMAEQQLAGVESLHPEDIADAIAYMVTRDRRAAVNEILVRPTTQVR